MSNQERGNKVPTTFIAGNAVSEQPALIKKGCLEHDGHSYRCSCIPIMDIL